MLSETGQLIGRRVMFDLDGTRCSTEVSQVSVGAALVIPLTRYSLGLSDCHRFVSIPDSQWSTDKPLISEKEQS